MNTSSHLRDFISIMPKGGLIIYKQTGYVIICLYDVFGWLLYWILLRYLIWSYCQTAFDGVCYFLKIEKYSKYLAVVVEAYLCLLLLLLHCDTILHRAKSIAGMEWWKPTIIGKKGMIVIMITIKGAMITIMILKTMITQLNHTIK